MKRHRPLQRTLAIIGKEYHHIWLDPGFFFLTVLAPAVLLTLLAYVFSFNVEHSDLAVMNQDQTQLAQDYLSALTADGRISLVAHPSNYDEVVRLLTDATADAALIIPPGFGADLKSGDEAEVHAVIDGTDPATAGSVLSTLEQRTQMFALSMGGQRQPAFDARMRVWFNANLDSQPSMIPGLMALVLILPSMAVALGIAREKEGGTFEMLVTTPLAGGEYLLGKLFVYISVGLISTLLALAVAVFWFKIPFRGELWVYLLLTTDYFLAVMGFCLVVAHFINHQRTVTSAILLMLFIPSFFLTGLIMPVDQTSVVSQAMAFSLPSTHYIVISRGIALKGLSLSDLRPEALTLLVMGIAAISTSMLVFNKKIR